jgi:hypothetical protein
VFSVELHSILPVSCENETGEASGAEYGIPKDFSKHFLMGFIMLISVFVLSRLQHY